LPVSLPVAIECQPVRALDVGALIGWHSMATGNDTGNSNANG